MDVEIKFNLPEEKEDMNMALRGPEFFYCLRDIDMEMRSHLKYDGKQNADQIAERVREIIWEHVPEICM